MVKNAGGWREVALRAAAAVPANYILTALATMLLARLLPGGPVAASTAATLLSFAIFAVIAMTAFAARSVARLWLALLAAALLIGGADWLLIANGGRL